MKSESLIARHRNCIYYDNFLESKMYSKEIFESKDKDEQIKEFKAYLSNNKFKLISKNKEKSSHENNHENNSPKSYKEYIETIISKNLSNEEKINLINDLTKLTNIKSQIKEKEDILEKLKIEANELSEIIDEKLK